MKRSNPLQIRVAPVSRREVPAYAELVAQHEMFRLYGLTPERLRQQIWPLAIEGDEDSRGGRVGAEGCSSLFLGASVRGEAAGLVWLVESGAFLKSGYIRLVVASTEWQGSGIADLLMERAEEHLLAVNPDVLLLVNADNRRARSFYERRGYRQVGSLPDYAVPGQTECIYRKRPHEQKAVQEEE